MTAALRKSLQTRSAEEIARIEEKWAVSRLLFDDADASEERQLQNSISARFAWDALSLNARDILHQMITNKVMDGVPRNDLQALTGLSEAALVAALAELEQSLMLIETRPDAKVRQRLEARGQQASYVLAIPKDFYTLFTTIHTEIYTPQGDRTKMPLTNVLSMLEPEKLQVMFTLTTHGKRSAGPGFYIVHDAHNLAPNLAGKLTQPYYIDLAWERIDATEQQICRYLCRADGVAEVSQVQSALNLSRSVMASYIDQLEHYGLVFDAFSGQKHVIFIGRGVFKVVRTLIGTLDQFQEQARQASSIPVELAETPSLVSEAQSRLLYDLAVITGCTYQMVIEPTQADRIPKRLVSKILPLLHGSRPNAYENADDYLDMLFAIARSLNLLKVQTSPGQKARYKPGPGLEEWAGMGQSEQTRLLLEVWEKASSYAWSDIAGANYRPGGYGYGLYIEAHASRQGLLVYLMEHCQAGRWYALKPFLQAIKLSHPSLLRERSRYPTYGGTRNQAEVLSNWDQVDAEIITGMLASSLHELGLVSLGYFEKPTFERAHEIKNPDAFQLTELAAHVMWHVQSTDGPEQPRSLIVQPNFELLLLQPDYPLLYQLLPFAKVMQVEMVSRLTLTQESVRRGVEAGYSVERIIHTLQECAKKELPQNILYTLQDWGRLYKDATVSQVLLLEVGNESIADEMCASPKFRALEMRRLGPCAIAIGGQVSLQVIRTTLEKEGIILHIQGDVLNAREFASTTTSGYGRRR